jgi:hypothetical protein
VEGFDPGWLHLREEADAEARDTGLVDLLRAHLAAHPPPEGTLRIHDLGSGTGSQLRWLSAHLPTPQHWTLHDHDPALLALAAQAADAAPGVTAGTSAGDLTRLGVDDLCGASLVTASALLDLLTTEEVHGLARTCAAAGVPALFTLSVVGRVELWPTDPLDTTLAEAFNDHQRRTVHGRRLLGPDAPAVAAAAFTAVGAEVRRVPSTWCLGLDRPRLLLQWLEGWLAAAAEQRPDQVGEIKRYRSRRHRQVDWGRLSAAVYHEDLLALPPRMNRKGAASVERGDNARRRTDRESSARRWP